MTSDGPIRVEANLRDLCPVGATDRQRAILGRLRGLDERGVVDDLTVHVWGRHLPVDPGETEGPAREAHDRFRAYERWAIRTGHELDPAFTRHERDGTMDGDAAAVPVVVPPLVSVAVYDDDDLSAVFPCRDGDTVYTIEDAIELLASGVRSPSEIDARIATS